jgi:cytochrome c biogenesis protein CcdA/thiol-disulfide isomerase/thioredoxin
MLLLIAVAFIAGLVTALSPCILPILPVVLASSTGGRRHPLALIIGLVTSFAAFTLVVSQIVLRLGLSASLLRLAAVIILGLLGLSMIVPALGAHLESWLSRLPGLAPQGQSDSGWRGGILTGATLGLVWAPCAGPILAAVTTLAATQRVNLATVAVALAYSIGVGVPLLIIAYGGQAVIRGAPFFSRRTVAIQKAFGGLMIVTAVLIAFNVDVTLSASAASLLPAGWSNQLNAIETNSVVTGELQSLSSQTPHSQPAAAGASLPNLGAAPELTGITSWINSRPLTLASLRGKVVVIDFWTYSCINCIRTLPYVTQWYEKYKDQGLVIIGVHSPEFAFEHDPGNVAQAVKRFNITYPVALDNNLSTWSAFENEYWPAEYFIDANGDLRYTHFGEGEYDQTERIIQALLAEADSAVDLGTVKAAEASIASGQTPETYLGLARQGQFASPEQTLKDMARAYTVPSQLAQDAFAVGGEWAFSLESAQEWQQGATLAIHFRAKDVYLVMTSDQPVTATVTIDGGLANHSEDINAQGQLTVSEARLYHLAGLDASASATLTVQFNQPGVKVYAFTFGS